VESTLEFLLESNFSVAKRIKDLYSYRTSITTSDIIDAVEIRKELNCYCPDTIAQVFSDIMEYTWTPTAFIKLHRLKILPFICPALSELDNHMYGNFSIFSHTMAVINTVENNNGSNVLKYAAVFHDIGKPDTYREQGGKPSFYGHEQRSEKIAWEFIKGYHLLSTDDANIVSDIILAHMKPHSLINATDEGIERFVTRYPRTWEYIIYFAIFDKLATVCSYNKCNELYIVLERAQKYAASLRS
jgi:hypothetical protein